MAHALGLSEQPQRPIIDLLKEHLEPREMLLVLDNFEHVVTAAGLRPGPPGGRAELEGVGDQPR